MSGLIAHAEQCLLGACLMDARAYFTAGHLCAEDFSDFRNGQIFDAIEAVAKGEGEVSPILVARCLPATARQELHDYMVALLDATPTAVTAIYYADFVRLHSRLRRANRHIRAGMDVSEAGSMDDATAALVRSMDAAREALEDVGGYADFTEALRLSEVAAGKSAREVSTTIPSLDHFLRGFSGPRLYVLGARTSVGKSLLAGQIAITATVRGDRVVGFISLEMSAGQIMARMVSYLGGDVETPGRTPGLYIDDRASELGDVCGRIRQWHARHHVDLVVVDYLQLVRAPQYRARYEEVGAVTRSLKRLCMEIKTPILALAQLSREHEKLGRRPGLGDLRECGNIEQDADVVLLMHPRENNRVEIAIAKNRDGRAGEVVPLRFHTERLGLVEEAW